MVPDDYIEERKCFYCGALYREVDNIGRLRCRIHPGIVQYDARSGYSYYSCCKRRDYPLSGGVGGCVKSDHQHEEFTDDDQEQRHREMEDVAILTLPTTLFQYGVSPSGGDTVIYNSGGGGKKKTITHRLPLGGDGGTVIEIDIEKRKHALNQFIKHSPSLSQLCATRGMGEESANLREVLDLGWRNTLEEEEGDGDNEGENGEETKCIVPFVIICRMK